MAEFKHLQLSIFVSLFVGFLLFIGFSLIESYRNRGVLLGWLLVGFAGFLWVGWWGFAFWL